MTASADRKPQTQPRRTDRALGPRPHGVLSFRDKHGAPAIAITAERKGKSGGGRRIRTLSGQARNIAYPYLSNILYDNTGRRFEFDAGAMREEYHAVSEPVAIQMLLLMAAVRRETQYKRACAMAHAIAGMNTCEAAWWNAKYNLKPGEHAKTRRPSRVMQALALMYT